MKITITYACGHEGTIQVFGNESRREWIAEQRAADLCPDCLEKKRIEQAIEAARENAEYGMEELEGSEKQIRWAEQIRLNLLKKIEEHGELLRKHLPAWADQEKASEIAEALIQKNIEALCSETKASVIIDQRFGKDWYKEMYKSMVQILKGEKDLYEPAPFVKVLEPEERKHPYEVRLEICESKEFGIQIEADYRKSEAFREIVKMQHGFWWSRGVWVNRPSFDKHSLTDCAAHLGSDLLAAGFALELHDPILEDKIKTGDFIPDARRFLEAKTIDGKDWFGFDIYKEDEALWDVLYDLATKSKWDGPVKCFFIKGKYWRQLQELIEAYPDIKVSEKAWEVIRAGEAVDRETVLIEKVDITPDQTDFLAGILNSSREVLDDLKD